MHTKEFVVSLTVYVRAEKENDLPEQREVENLACGLLMTPPATDTDAGWNVYATHITKGDHGQAD